jgi:hypothetical protein
MSALKDGLRQWMRWYTCDLLRCNSKSTESNWKLGIRGFVFGCVIRTNRLSPRSWAKQRLGSRWRRWGHGVVCLCSIKNGGFKRGSSDAGTLFHAATSVNGEPKLPDQSGKLSRQSRVGYAHDKKKLLSIIPPYESNSPSVTKSWAEEQPLMLRPSCSISRVQTVRCPCRREVYWHAVKLALIIMEGANYCDLGSSSIKQSNVKDYSIRLMATEHKQSDLNTMDTIIHPQQF